MLLATLINKDRVVSRTCSDCIANVFRVEQPANGWPALIPVLVQNCSNENPLFRQAAITTLGFVCEQVKRVELQLDPAAQEAVISGILMGFKSEADASMRATSLEALRDCLPAMKQVFAKPEVKNYIVAMLCELQKNADSPIALRQVGLQVLMEVCKHYYLALEENMPAIIAATVPLISTPSDESLCVSAIEVWSTIAEEYKDLVAKKVSANNYITPLLTDFYQLFLKSLLVYESDEDDENGIASAAENALVALADISTSVVLEIVGNFVSNTVGSEDWKFRRAGITAFNTVIEFADRETIKDMCGKAFPQFAGLLRDKALAVRKAASKGLSRMVQYYPESIITSPAFEGSIELVMASLEDDLKVVYNTAWFITYLYEAIKHGEFPLLVSAASGFIYKLIACSARGTADPKEAETHIDICFMAIYNIIHNSNNSALAESFLERFLAELEGLQKVPETPRDLAFMNKMFSSIHACLLVFQKNGSRPEMRVLTGCYGTVQRLFRLFNDVLTDGIYVLGSLACILKGEFRPRFEESWPFVQHGLYKTTDAELFRGSVGALGDFARAIGKDFYPQLNDVLRWLVQCIKDPAMDRHSKTCIFIVIGDLALSTGDLMWPYVDQVLEIYQIGMEAAIELTKTNPESEYCDELKECLMDSLLCFTYGVCKDQPCPKLLSFKGKLADFIQFCCNRATNPTLELLYLCALVLVDLLRFYQTDIKGLFDRQFV